MAALIVCFAPIAPIVVIVVIATIVRIAVIVVTALIVIIVVIVLIAEIAIIVMVLFLAGGTKKGMYVDIFKTDKKYNIIYADPPWAYRDKASAGRRGACFKYPVMKTSDIMTAFPVKDISADDCVLFMWVTMPKLSECFDLIEAWGFTYKTVAFVWIKQNKKADSLFWGMGRWTRANAELCLIATKGKPSRLRADVHSVVFSKIEKHSKKPDEVRERIVKLCGDIPRIELFARQQSEGWDCFGNELSEE